jgi:predicted Zn-dependent protease
MCRFSEGIEVQNYFYELSGDLFAQLKSGEVLLLAYAGETSDFVRFNQNKIRQAGCVTQQSMRLILISGAKQSQAVIQLSGDMPADFQLGKHYVIQLREQLPLLPEDPYLNFSTQIHNTTHMAEHHAPQAGEAIEDIIGSAAGMDLVGVWAGGDMLAGFSNSLGQFNWHSEANFNFDWSVYLKNDKAIKQSYAGFQWQREVLQQKLGEAKQTLALLAKPAKTIEPGRYRVFLTPTALNEICGLLGWGGFGLKSHRTAQTPLLKMIKDGVTLNAKVGFTENHAEGLAPRFTATGFIKPDAVSLIENGKYRQTLNGARSAKEYGADVNSGSENPQSLHIAPGTLDRDDIYKTLDTGLYISNLWYCNYSDRGHCRITGMTRFATLWVENGAPVAPVNVMRFDDTLYHMLGDNLVDFTRQREQIFDAGSYESRSESSALLPGALIEDFRFTL